MIEVVGLEKSFGARVLFEDVSLLLTRGARYGLVGANGSGKTTFLKVVAGDDTPSQGTVNIAKTARVGVLRQDRFLNDDDRIIDVAMAGDEIVSKALAEQHRLLEDETPDASRLAELEDVIGAHDGYTLEPRASAILEGLGIPSSAHTAPLSTLSGGFKLRVLLAQVLLGGPDVLLLDEPTNHLDILSIRWLENFLRAYQGCALVISHDEQFLNAITTHILDVDYGTITSYTGNYAAFAREKEAVYERNATRIARAEAEIAAKRAWVERFGAKATKARQAQSRLKQIEKIEVGELKSSSRREPNFQFLQRRPSGRDVLAATDIVKAYGDKHVLRGVSLTVRRGERVAVIGPNGLGKSTLLKILTGQVAADSGTVKWGHETHLGYFPQDHREVLTDASTSTLDVIWNAAPAETTSYVRGQLGRVLFSGEEVMKKVGLLSGGEAARVVFCKMMVEKPNVLVLDEPTNHLDLESIHALSRALKTFEGSLIFVSHDRAFVSALATRILEVTPSGFQEFPGTYEEYLAKRGDDHLDADAVVLKAKKERSGAGKSVRPALTRDEQKKRQNRQKKLPQLRDQLLASIEAAEARKAEIHERFCAPDYYEKTPAAEAQALQAEADALGPRIEALLHEWEAIEKELEELRNDTPTA